MKKFDGWLKYQNWRQVAPGYYLRYSTVYLNKFNKKHLKKLFYANKRRCLFEEGIYFIQNIKILYLLKLMQGFN